MSEPTFCPACAKFIVGETRSFCVECRETFADVSDRWFRTERHANVDVDTCSHH